MSIQKTFNKIHTTNFQIIRIPGSSPLPLSTNPKIPNLIHRRKVPIIQALNICKSKKTLRGNKNTTMIINKRKMIKIIMEINRILKVYKNKILNWKILLVIQ